MPRLRFRSSVVAVLTNFVVPESNTQNGGKYQKFDKSRSIYWHPSRTGGSARSIGGLIRDKWVARGYELGDHGYPTTRELNARKPGKYNRFESGGIYCQLGDHWGTWHPPR
ncbi:MAG: hypothetical protein WAV90_22905 [Gordonia amarae]